MKKECGSIKVMNAQKDQSNDTKAASTSRAALASKRAYEQAEKIAAGLRRDGQNYRPRIKLKTLKLRDERTESQKSAHSDTV